MGRIITTDIREREDLSDVIDMLLLKDSDLKFLSFVNFLGRIRDVFGKRVTAQKHEWLDDAARAVTFTAIASGGGADWDTNSDITDLPVVTAQVTKLRVGDVLLLPGGDEVAIVSVIDVTAQTIDLYARGHGSSTATAQGTSSLTIKIIGNAQAENSDPIGADNTTQSAGVNYTQIFEDVAAVSGTLRRSLVPGGDHLDYQIIKKLKESLVSLNYAMVEGIVNLDSTNKIGTMGGLREFISNTSNVGGALTLALLYTALVVHLDAGLVPHAIHGSATTISKIEQLFTGNVRTKPSDTRANMSVNVISMLGWEVQLHVDRHVRTTEFLILDYGRCAYDSLNGGEYESGVFAVYPLLDIINGKQTASQVLGEYTMRVSNGGGTRAYGIS